VKSAFLPLGLVAAFLLAWLEPTPGSLLKDAGLIPWVVVGLFLVNGYQTNLAELPRKRQFLHLLIIAAVINLGIAPILGVATAAVAGLNEGETLGLIVKSAVPSTLSTCIVLTQLAGGYSLWALVMTLALNILAVFTLPFVLGLALSDQSAFAIDPLDLLITLIQLVLIPFLVGALLRRLSLINPQHLVLQYLPSTLVISAVWMSLSSSSALFSSLQWQSLLLIAAASLAVHLALMVCAALCGALMRIEWQAHVALIFTASQKTLPVAVSVLATLNGEIGEALLVCVLFHFLQLFVDSTLPGPIRRWTERMQARH